MPHETLSARQEDRRPLILRAEFEIAPGQREQIRFSPSSNAPKPHVTAGRSIDISPAGMGLVCDQYVPRMTEGLVRLFASSATPDHSEKLVFEHPAKIRRVSLRIADKPSYLLGTAFLDPAPQLETKINDLLRHTGPAAAPSAPTETRHA